MTENPFSGRPWWEYDPTETPVPLDPDASWELGDDAELIVASERAAIEREDTEPNLVTLIAAARGEREDRSVGSDGRRPLRKRSAVLALAAGCVAMFVHGYSYGSAARDRAEPALSRGVGSVTSDVHQPDSLGGPETKTPEDKEVVRP